MRDPLLKGWPFPILIVSSSAMFLLNILSLLATGVATLSFKMEAHYDESVTRLHKRAEYPDIYMEAGVSQARVYYSVGTDTNSQQTNGILTAYAADLVIQTSSNPKCSSDSQTINQGKGVNCTFAIHSSADGVEASTMKNTWVYGAGSTNTTINFFEADINLNDDVFDNFTFMGIANGVTNPYFGVGYPFESFQASYDLETGNVTLPTGYSTPMQAMKSQGLILSESYSVWLASTDPWSPGGLTLGGFDQLRFDGNLTSFPIEHEWYELGNGTVITLESYSGPIVAVSSVSITDFVGDETTIMSGMTQFSFNFETQTSTLPKQLADVLGRMFYCTYESTTAYYVCPCGVPEGNLTFNIRGYEMHFPFSSFIRPLRDYNGDWLALDDGTLECFLAVNPTTNPAGFSLGMAMLTSQYVVVHMETNEIGVSPYSGDNSSGYEIYQMDDSEMLFATQAPSYSSSYDLSDSTFSVYTPNFNVSVSFVSTNTAFQSVSSASQSAGSSGAGVNDATATTTGSNLKDSTTYVRTVISTVNGSPPLVLSPAFVLAWILGVFL